MSHKIPSYYRYVSALTISNAGSGYDSANPPTITISGGGGTGATASCTVYNGEIDTVTVTNIGSGYTSTPTVTVSGSGGAVLTATLSFAAGPTTEYTETIVNKIKDTLPEFVRTDHPLFVSFLEKYYEWAEQETGPLNSLYNKHYNDINESNDAELEKWRLLLARKYPQSIAVDKKYFYKNVKNLYETKGTVQAIQTFFRVFYGEDIEVLYPSNYVLRASDGRWVEEKSIRVYANNNYEVLNLFGKLININYYVTTGTGTKITSIPATVISVAKISATSPQSYELFLSFENAVTDIPGPGSQGTGTITFDGPIASVNNISAADPSRAAGTYAIGASDYTADRNGTNATFSVVVDGTGDATITITDDGTLFTVGETITIADANLGGGGAADLTFKVATLKEGIPGTFETSGSTLTDASRTAGTYTITTSDYTTSGSGINGAFTVVVDANGSVKVGSGDSATVNVTTTGGTGFEKDDTITIPDSALGGGGADDLVLTIKSLALSELTIAKIAVGNAGYQYTAAPTVTFNDENDVKGSGGAAYVLLTTDNTKKLSSYTVTSKGSGYNSSTTSVVLNTDGVRTFITLRDEQAITSNAKAYLDRVLTSVSAASYSGSETDVGFRKNKIFAISESGEDARGYALNYFAEDYVIIGGKNSAKIKVAAVDSNYIPTSWIVTSPGYNFNNAETTVEIYSGNGEFVTSTLVTGYLFNYEGKYTDDRGKLSDVNKIQDNFRYQSFSYVIKSTHPQSEWNQNLKDTVHPAGWRVIGDLAITNEISFGYNIETPQFHIRYFEDFTSNVATTSETVTFHYEMVKTDTATATEAVAKLVEKPFADSLLIGVDDTGGNTYFADDYVVDPDDYVSEGGFFVHLHRVLDLAEGLVATGDEIGTIDFTKVITDAPIADDAGEQTYFANDAGDYLDNDFYVREGGLSVEYEKVVADSASATELFAYLYTWGLNPSDTVTATESFSYEMVKFLSVSDTVTATESISPVVEWVATFTDTATTAETVEIGTSLPFTETQSVSDSPVYSVGLNASDTVSSISDAINNFNIAQALADTATTEDAASLEDENEVTVGKVLSETANASEAHAISFVTSFADSASATESFFAQIFIPIDVSDSVTATESSTLTVGKNPSDTATTADLGTSWTLTRAIADTATTDDRASIEDENQVSVGKTLADSVTTSDSVITEVSIQQVLADSATATQQLIVSYDLNNAETLSSTDVPVINTSNANTDSAGAAEADAKDFGKNITDSGALATESATANVQDFMDPTYLAEDYVGDNYSL